MNAALNWDEFRLVKAIADSRSLTGAASILGLNHSTVFRRLGALEEAVGGPLFERSRSGYDPTPAGEEMIALATTMADSVVEFERRVAGRDVKPAGRLRVTTSETIGLRFLPPILAQFQGQSPNVVVDVILSEQPLNLAKRDADVAIRVTNHPHETLIGRRVSTVGWAIYGPRGLGEQAMLSDETPFVGFVEDSGPSFARRWIEANVRPERVAARVNSTLAMVEMIAQGLGAGPLPCFLGEAHAKLARLGPPMRAWDMGLWILIHSDLRRSARVRAFMDFAGAELFKHRKTIEGCESE